MPTLSTLIQAAKTFQSLVKFVESGGLARELSSDTDLNAARRSLKDSEISNNPHGQVLNAIGHLEHCLEDVGSIKIRELDYVTTLEDLVKREAVLYKIQYVCCFLAYCYSYLQEDRLRDKYLSLALGCEKALKPKGGEIKVASSVVFNFVTMIGPFQANKMLAQKVLSGKDTYADVIEKYRLKNKEIKSLKNKLLSI